MTKKFIYNNANGDNQESPGAYETSDFINSSTGAADSGKPIVLDANGKIDPSMISFDSLSWKNPVRVASTANINIASPGITIDSTTLAAGDRILVKDQTTPTENGIYVFDTSTTPLTRASDFNEDSEVVAGSAVIVTEGMMNADTCWIVTTNDPITIGITDIVFGPLPLVAGNNFGLFPIWAEENGAIANNQREWSFGNGATGDIGITLPIDAQIFAVSYQADNAGTNSEVSVEVNAVSVTTTGPQSTNSGINVLATSIPVSVGDVIGFRTITGGGASDVRVCAWLKIPLAALTDLALDNLSDVVISAPASGQVLYFNGTAWVNQQLDKNDVGLGNVDNTSDLDKPISTATQAALDDKIDKGGVCRIVNTGETYNSIATAVSALSDYDTLHIFSQNSTEDIDLTGSNLSNVTFFGMGSSGTKNTVVGRVLLDNTCDSIEFHNIDMVTAGNDTVVDTGSTNTRFNECNISRTSGSVSVRISGSGPAAPAFSGCVITQDISLNGTNLFGFIYIKDSTIDDILSNSAQGAVIDRTLVNSSLQFTGGSYVEIRNTITPTIISSQPSLGFTSLVISNTHIRDPFTAGAVGIINKTGTAPYSLLDVDFDVAGSTLTGTDNSSAVPVSFAINCRGKNLADINALSRVAGTLHNAQDQSNKPYWDDGSTVNEIAYTSSITPAPVDSVNGQTGVVVLDADDIDDSTTTNKYATQSQLDKVDFLTVTQNVDLDTLESDVAINNAKVSASGSIDTHSDVDLTGLANNDILVYDSGTSTFKPEPAPSGAVDSVNGQTGVVVLDADDIDDSTTTNKYATQAQLDKVDFLTVTQAVDLDTLESDVTANNAKVSASGSIDTHSDVDLTGLADNDILIYDSGTSTFKPEPVPSAPVSSVNLKVGVVVLDADDIGDSTTTNKFATQSQLDKVDFLTVTQPVDLDTIESDVTTNNAKVSASGSIGTHSDVDLTGLADNDILVYDSGTSTFKPEAAPPSDVTSVNGQTGAVVLDADDIDDSTTTNKYATQSQLDKIDFLTVTQAVDLDTLESDVAANNAKVSASGSIGTHSDVDLTGLSDNDILVYDSGTSTFKPEPAPSGAVDSVNGQTGTVVLDADDIDDSTTTNKYATQSQLDKVDFLTVTQAVDLDTLETDVTANNAKVSASGSIGTHSDVDLTGLSNDDILVYDSISGTFKPEAQSPSGVTSVNGQTGVVVLDADDIDDSTTTNKFATQSQLDKVDFISVTQPVDLDTLESDVAINNAKVSASLSINTHSDVDTVTNPPTSGDFLRWNSANNEWEPDSLVSTTFTYRKSFVAERSTASGGKLALGNGATINTMGVVITEECKLVSVGISSAGVTNGTWDIFRNGTSIHSTIKPVSLTYVDNLVTPVTLNPNDYLNATCLAAGGAAHTVTFEVEITKTITGLKGDQGAQGIPGTDGIAQVRTGTGAPANTLGNDGDFYLDNNTGNYYTKSGGVWTLQGNLTGPSGAIPKILKLTNVFANNINSNTTLTFSGFDTSPLINDYGADITVASNGLTFVTGGRFRLDFNFFLTSNASRTNVLFRWAINGVEQRGRSAHNYIRNGSGHNESSSCLSEILDLSAGDVLTITCLRLGGAGTVNVPAGESIFQIESLS